MREELRRELVCPACGSPLRSLEFTVDEQVRDGILACDACCFIYPIINYVPVMFGYETTVARKYLNQRRDQVDRVAEGYTLPKGHPPRGEAFVQRSFSAQWEALDINHGLQYNYTDEDLLRIARVQLGLEDDWFAGRRILDAGCGAGKEAIMLQRASGTTVFAFDLNFSLLGLGERVKHYPDIHFFLASIWSLPLRANVFDYVYSHGVLHHTHSTEQAVKTLARYVAPGGYYYFWIYGIRPARKFRHAFAMPVQERILRPIISRLPRVLQALALVPFAARTHVANRRKFQAGQLLQRPTWRNSWLMASDYFTPLFAHWHPMGEAILWLKDLGFEAITPLELEELPDRFLHVWIHNVGLRSQRPGEAGASQHGARN